MSFTDRDDDRDLHERIWDTLKAESDLEDRICEDIQFYSYLREKEKRMASEQTYHSDVRRPSSSQKLNRRF